MKQLYELCVPAILSIVVLFTVLLIVSSNLRSLTREAIERGYAQHNPKTGAFEWVEQKGEQKQ